MRYTFGKGVSLARTDISHAGSCIGFASNEIVVVRKNQNTVNVFINKTERFIEIESHADCVRREPFEIALDFRNVVFDNDLTDLSR